MHSYRPVPVVFFSLDSGKEPAREWLKALNKQSKRTIGEDIKTLQFGWPVGMPLARKLDAHVRDLRSKLDNGIARIFFTVRDTKIVLLHGFIEKTQKTPARELSLARRRLNKLRAEQ